MIEMKPDEIRIDTIWGGPGKGSTLRVIYLPLKISVEKHIENDDKVSKIKQKLMKELAEKINKQ